MNKNSTINAIPVTNRACTQKLCIWKVTIFSFKYKRLLSLKDLSMQSSYICVRVLNNIQTPLLKEDYCTTQQEIILACWKERGIKSQHFTMTTPFNLLVHKIYKLSPQEYSVANKL